MRKTFNNFTRKRNTSKKMRRKIKLRKIGGDNVPTLRNKTVSIGNHLVKMGSNSISGISKMGSNSISGISKMGTNSISSISKMGTNSISSIRNMLFEKKNKLNFNNSEVVRNGLKMLLEEEVKVNSRMNEINRIEKQSSGSLESRYVSERKNLVSELTEILDLKKFCYDKLNKIYLKTDTLNN